MAWPEGMCWSCRVACVLVIGPPKALVNNPHQYSMLCDACYDLVTYMTPDYPAFQVYQSYLPTVGWKRPCGRPRRQWVVCTRRGVDSWASDLRRPSEWSLIASSGSGSERSYLWVHVELCVVSGDNMISLAASVISSHFVG